MLTSTLSLTPDELRRYARHIILPGLGEEGQLRLKQGRVLLVGAGGLGSPVALYLAAAGVGTLGLVDDDRVDQSNLQRQILYGDSTVGALKLDAAEARLRDLNPHVTVERHPIRLDSSNALDIVRRFDVIVDGSDNFPTRYLVNDACVLARKPDVYGSIFRFEGQVSVFAADRGPCYRCLFRDPPPPELIPSCDEAGVIGVIPGIVGCLQALEVVKLVAGVGEPLIGRLLLVDGLTTRFRELRLQKDPECSVCGSAPSVTELIDYETFCGTSRLGSAVSQREIEPQTLAQELAGESPPVLVDVREQWEWAIGRLETALHIPLGVLQQQVPDLDLSRPVVAYCHHGVRSLTAQQLLAAAGFTDVRSLRGGIDGWARQIDRTIPRY